MRVGGSKAGESLCWITGQVIRFCAPFEGGYASQGHCDFKGVSTQMHRNKDRTCLRQRYSRSMPGT